MALALEDVLTSLGIEAHREALEPHWDESEASYPAEGPPLLDDKFIKAERAYVSLPGDVDAPLLEAAGLIRARPELAHVAWHCERLLYEEPRYDAGRFREWPTFDAQLGDLAGCFYLLIALAAAPRTREAHRKRGVPDEITRDIWSHLDESARTYCDQHDGCWGLAPRVLFWFRNHVAGELYRFGRLEFMCRPFYHDLHVFRSRRTDEVLALAGDGTCFDAEGFVDSYGAGNGWTARFVEMAGAVTGCPISPAGVALPTEVTLPLTEWRRALSRGDHVLETHIPAGGNMTLERCHDSMRRALEFFPRHFPERPFKGFGCASWILNPQLDWIYRPDSNMVLFQREVYLYPIPSGGRSGLYFIFGEDDPDPATAPRETSLQRALLEHLAAGGRVIAGGMFMLMEDFGRFGTQHYRSHWPPSVLAAAVRP
jgi:hypothetical protein